MNNLPLLIQKQNTLVVYCMDPPSSPHKNFIAANNKNNNHAHNLLCYVHLFKAGGASLCKLEGKNMPKQQVPDYFCMPPDVGKEIDGRVGRSNKKLLGCRSKNPGKRFVSNEWNPFASKERWDLNDQLLFVTTTTTLQDPLDRLMSAYCLAQQRTTGTPSVPALVAPQTRQMACKSFCPQCRTPIRGRSQPTEAFLVRPRIYTAYSFLIYIYRKDIYFPLIQYSF